LDGPSFLIRLVTGVVLRLVALRIIRWWNLTGR
jgi:hypothetical protein